MGLCFGVPYQFLRTVPLTFPCDIPVDAEVYHAKLSAFGVEDVEDLLTDSMAAMGDVIPSVCKLGAF